MFLLVGSYLAASSASSCSEYPSIHQEFFAHSSCVMTIPPVLSWRRSHPEQSLLGLSIWTSSLLNLPCSDGNLMVNFLRLNDPFPKIHALKIELVCTFLVLCSKYYIVHINGSQHRSDSFRVSTKGLLQVVLNSSVKKEWASGDSKYDACEA